MGNIPVGSTFGFQFADKRILSAPVKIEFFKDKHGIYRPVVTRNNLPLIPYLPRDPGRCRRLVEANEHIMRQRREHAAAR